MTAISRRQFLALSGAGAAGVALAGCSGPGRVAEPVEATDPAVAALEQRRRGNAAVREIALTAAPLTLDLGGGLTAATWGYNGSVPGPEVRLTAGEVLRARFTNNLPEPTTVHWHGLALRNDMDGVPDLTQALVPPGGTFNYEFTVPDPGTYWFHPHTGLHLDKGLYSPLIVEDPRDPGAYDREYTVVIDDWADGLGQPAEATLDDLRAGRGAHAAHLAAAKAGGEAGPTVPELRSAPGDVNYPLYLINGRRPTAPVTFDARPGERLRLRLVNAGSDTPFRVAVGGHQMLVTHTDGFPVDPVLVDNLIIAMAERYDVVVTVNGSGVFPLVAVAEAKTAQALALIRSGPGDPPASDAQPAELKGRVLQLSDLRSAQTVRFGSARPDRLYAVELGGGEEGYVWTINGRPHGADEPLKVREGEKVRLAFHNTTVMFHPMHLHGHTFQVVLAGGLPGPRKDTTIVRPDERVAVDFVADNPGQWMLHCHNLYHQSGGMMTTVSYVRDADAGSSSSSQRAAAARDRVRMACQWAGKLAVS
ncbi:MAG: multicopper oxidase family protein [Acidimicrobiales bacterium]